MCFQRLIILRMIKGQFILFYYFGLRSLSYDTNGMSYLWHVIYMRLVFCIKGLNVKRWSVFLPLSTVNVLGVARESIQQEEDVSAACDSVTNPRSFLQQAFLPHELAAADARVQVLRLLIDQIGFCKKIRHTCARRRRRYCKGDVQQCSIVVQCSNNSVPGAPWHQCTSSFSLSMMAPSSAGQLQFCSWFMRKSTLCHTRSFSAPLSTSW